jgi:hypothetical protein
MKALTVKMEKDCDTDWLKQNLTFFLYQVYEMNSKIYFLGKSFILLGVV